MKKIVFDLTPEQEARLAKMAKKMGVSKTEAIRRAIELYQIQKQGPVITA